MGSARPLLAATAACAVALSGCAAASRTPQAPAAASAPAGAKPAADDTALDWHPLLAAPFGTFLKDMPLALHEVLLFHDAAHGGADIDNKDIDNKDCYAADRAPPVFLGAKPRVYLFCFTHDHLTRIEAIVDLPAATAAATFTRACALWRKRALPATPPNPSAATDSCDGQEVGMAFGGRQTAEADGAAAAVSFTAFSLAAAAATAETTPAPGRPGDHAAPAAPADGGPLTPPHP